MVAHDQVRAGVDACVRGDDLIVRDDTRHPDDAPVKRDDDAPGPKSYMWLFAIVTASKLQSVNIFAIAGG